jgi:hypothetical protein
MPPRSIELRDGRAVDARPVRARDAGQVQAFVRALSPQSRRERFFAPIAELSPRQLGRVVSGPGLSLAAWQPGGSVVGLAQYALGERLLAAKLGFAFRRDEDPALLRMERLLAA